MKLVELVTYFRNGGDYKHFCQSHSLDPNAEVVEVYMEKPFSLENKLAFFEIEKTEGQAEYDYSATKYFNLFDFYYFLDAIEESKSSENQNKTDLEIAERLLNYATNDA